MFSWMNFLIFPLVILSSGYLTELSSNLLASRGGRNKTIPLQGSRYCELVQSVPGIHEQQPDEAKTHFSDNPQSPFTVQQHCLVSWWHWCIRCTCLLHDSDRP